MNRLFQGIWAIGILSLFALVSCSLSGRSTSSQSPGTPNPTELSMVETAQALLRQTEQIREPSPTAIPTETLTATPQVSLSGTSLIFLEDQTTEFIDHKAGIKLTIPAGWLAVRVNEDEYYKAFASPIVLENPSIFNRLNQIQTHDVAFFRLDAIDTRPGHIINGLISDISVIFQEGDTRTLEEWRRVESRQVSPYSGFKYISSTYQTTTDGTRVVAIERSWDWTSGGSVYYRGVFFSLPTGTIVLDFQTNLGFKETVLPDFEQVVNSLTLLTP